MTESINFEALITRMMRDTSPRQFECMRCAQVKIEKPIAVHSDRLGVGEMCRLCAQGWAEEISD